MPLYTYNVYGTLIISASTQDDAHSIAYQEVSELLADANLEYIGQEDD